MLIVMLPFLLAGNAMGQVFFQRAAAERAAGRPIAGLVDQVVHRLIWFSVLPAGVLMLIGPEILTFVLGPQWGPAGSYARLLAPWWFMATTGWTRFPSARTPVCRSSMTA